MTSEVKNELHDKLLLEMLDLIEQSVRCKIDIETTTNAGQLLLAKSRYIEGAQSVTKSRLPTENSTEFSALKTVTESQTTTFHSNQLVLNVRSVDKESGFIDPIRWFGVLVPRSLQLARDRFNRAVEMAVECANVQLKLNQIISFILLLQNKKVQ